MAKAPLLATLSSLALASGLTLGTPAPAGAEEAAAAAATFDTVIVTARKRAEVAQSVPIAISVYDQKAIEQLNVRTVEDLRYIAPSVHVAQSTFRADTVNITIRGQRNFDSTGLQFDTAAALYVNGVYYARPVGLNGTLFDVDTVQVLKGPQGTLVGRNTTGGAILYQTRTPADVFEGYLKVTGGDYDRREVEGAINIPLGEHLAFRASGAYSDIDGYIRNFYVDPASGYRNNVAAQGHERKAGLFSLKWTPDDTLSVLLRANLSAFDSTGAAYAALGAFEGTTLAAQGRPSICNIPGTCTGFTDLLNHRIEPYYSDFNARTINTSPAAYNALLNSVKRIQERGFWTTEQALSNVNRGRYQTYSAAVDKALGENVSVHWMAAHRAWETSGTASSRGLPYATNIFYYNAPAYRSDQSELTVNGESFADRLKWTTGLFYFRENSPNDGDQLYLFLPSGNVPFAAAGRQITYTDPTRNDGRNTSYAAYAQATYDLLETTRLTAGVRYTVDKRFAHLETQTVRTPATAATTATVPNGVFDPAAFTLLGVTYLGQTRACALTNTAGVLLPLSQCSVDVNRTFKEPTWTLAIDHDLARDLMIYATARTGYRSGAINSAAINPAVIVAWPEEVTDYEVGLKADWSLGGVPVRTNLAAYYTDYKNIQIRTTLPNVTIATAPGAGGVNGPCTQAAFNANQCVGFTNDDVTLNARKARVKGVEWELMARPLAGLTLSTTGSYLDGVYTDYTFTPPAGYLLPTGATNLSGTPIPLPKWQINSTVSYALAVTAIGPLTFEEFVLTARSYWQSANRADRRPYSVRQLTSGYELVDLRLDIRDIAGSRVDLTAFMTNATNKRACTPESQGVLGFTPQGSFGVAGTSGVVQCLPLPPRMTGASLSYRF